MFKTNKVKLKKYKDNQHETISNYINNNNLIYNRKFHKVNLTMHIIKLSLYFNFCYFK